MLRATISVPTRAIAPRARPAEDTSPARVTLERIARLVTPLSLTDSTSPEFTPERCQSLHDVTRFVHEMAYEVVFEWADVRWDRTSHARRLDVRLPLEVHVIDVGGGLRAVEGRVRAPSPAADNPPMCGRYAMYGPVSRYRDHFGVDDAFDFAPRFNVAPSDGSISRQRPSFRSNANVLTSLP